jgi:hypothetical protein
MNLQTIFDQLRTGELSQMFLSEVDPVTGEFTDEKKAQLLNHISLGLTALYRRFNLKQGRITVERVDGVEKYVLDKNYAESNLQSKEPVKYIKDTLTPFMNDLLKITQVTDFVGREVKLNEMGNPLSVFTPTYNILVVPADLDSSVLHITYQAGHKPLGNEALFYPPEYVFIELPEVYLEALLYFIASRAHNPVGMDNTFHQGNNWASLYEKVCQELSDRNYQLEANYSTDKFYCNGWV